MKKMQLSEPSLASRNFDDMTSSVKGFGLWCFYEDEAYNTQNPESGYICAGDIGQTKA